MQSSTKYTEDRSGVEKQIVDIQSNIIAQNPKIAPEDANKIARSLRSSVLTYIANFGAGTASIDAIMQQLSQSIATPKGNVTLIGVDMGVMAKVVDTEKFKISLGGGIGAGLSSDGFFAFAHVGAEGKLTAIDKSTLDSLKDNK
jgi:hypothetical protein